MQPIVQPIVSGLARVEADAADRGVSIEIVVRPGGSSLDEAAQLLGLAAHSVVKTLVVKRHDGAYLFALVPGDRQISWPKLRAIVGVNRLRLPEAHLAFEITGYERGTITPFGSLSRLPVIADSRVAGRVALGAGTPGHSLLVDAAALLSSFGATVADISNPRADPAEHAAG